MNNFFIISTILVLLAGCQGGSSSGEQETHLSQPLAVYNNAYQENYEFDDINYIASNAKNAYVLLDTVRLENLEVLETLKNNGNLVSGYISVGTGETYRDDFSVLEPHLSSKPWGEWPDEFFVSNTTGVLPIMQKRIDKLSEIGMEWVEFDNMDWFTQKRKAEYNLSATLEESKIYINTLCDYARTKGLKCMAKNMLEGFENFDGITYESYHDLKNWWDTIVTSSFLEQKKPVIIVHYNELKCDTVYEEYKRVYNNDKISFICEDRTLKRYKHYNEQ